MIINSGVTNIARVLPFEVGNEYKKYDVVYYSGYTNPSPTPPRFTRVCNLNPAIAIIRAIALQPQQLLIGLTERTPNGLPAFCRCVLWGYC